MSEQDTAQLLYLSILLGALLFYGLVSQRRQLGKMIRHLILWALIFIGVMAGYLLWQDLGPRLMAQLAPVQITYGNGVIEIPKNRNGQFVLNADVNGVETEFLIDTGASNIVLSKDDALRAGITMDEVLFSGSAQTANGTVQTARVRIDTLNFGGIEETSLPAYVTDGDLFGSLLGMAYLQRFERIEILGDKLILTR